MEIFGFEISRKRDELRATEVDKKAISFVPPVDDDGTPVIQSQPGGFITGGAYGSYIDMEGGIKNESELIRRYREISLIPECDSAIEDIVNECITSDTSDRIVSLDLRDVKLSDSIKDKIQDEFYHILNIMRFNQNSHELFRKWYIDGRVYFHKVVDSKRPKAGIVDIRNIDPVKIKKVRNIEKERDNKTNVEKITKMEEFYLFNDRGFDKSGSGEGNTVKIAPEAVCYTTSGLLDYTKNVVVGYLHKAMKTANQLSMIEDALVIYRISRAPERRIFYIDVGNLPKAKAEQYLSEVMNKYRNKLVYNAQTGEIKDDRKHMSMLEDFWLPRREGGRGTEISTLPGGENLGQIDDIIYFQKRLYKSLNVPVGRLEQENQFSLGRSTEISRDELKFQKFIDRLRSRFNYLFYNILKKQLILKGLITQEDWEDWKNDIIVDYMKDNHFTELRNAELQRERLQTLDQMQQYVGEFFSKEWIMKNVLQMDDEDMKNMKDQIDQEMKDGEIGPDDDHINPGQSEE